MRFSPGGSAVDQSLHDEPLDGNAFFRSCVSIMFDCNSLIFKFLHAAVLKPATL
jgi:hypothetical protein